MNQKELRPIQLLPLGDKAVVLQFENEVSESNHSKIQAVAQYLRKHPLPGIIEFVPAYATLTVYYEPWVLSNKGHSDPYDKLIVYLETALQKTKEQKLEKGRIVEIPVCYGGFFGPDLELVADYNNLKPSKVIELHAQTHYLVHMMGFAPGFAYLGGMDRRIATPRREAPRPAIPIGSIGIAGEQTGIYPIETPGGWQLIGRTPLELFNPDREKPSLLEAGDRVKFIPITENEYQKQLKRHEH